MDYRICYRLKRLGVVLKPSGPGKASRRPVRTVGAFLVGQALLLSGIGAYNISRIDWGRVRTLAAEQAQSIPAPLSDRLSDAVLYAVLFFPPALLTLVSGLSFLVSGNRGWLAASIAQGISLAVCLLFYAEIKPGYVYPIMAYSVFMVLYLNSRDVRLAFHARREGEGSGG
jgi:hypothetical protein